MAENYPSAVRESTKEEIEQRERAHQEQAQRIDTAIDTGIRKVIQAAYGSVGELPDNVRNAVAVQVVQQAMTRLQFTLDAAHEAVRRLNWGNNSQVSESPSAPFRRY